MRRLSYIVPAAAFTVVMAVAPDLRADPLSATPLDGPQLSSKTRFMHTVPDSKVAEQDAEEAAVAIEQRKRDEELIRELFLTPRRRPDLDHDVVQGIQSLNVENALRRR